MKWNWELSDWPNFSYTNIDKFKEARFHQNAGILSGIVKHLSHDDLYDIRVDILSHEAIKSSEIEGEILERKSIQSSIKRHFKLEKSTTILPPSEVGISDMLLDIYHSYEKKLSHKHLFDLNKHLLGHQTRIPSGKYRSHKEPMQIISGNSFKPKVHFQAPPSSLVKEEMDNFISWFNDSSVSGKKPLPCLIRASIAHLYFESIHPFEDGNGRIGRALVKKIISQHIGAPTLVALSHVIFDQRKNYYKTLEKYSKTLDISGWINYFSDIILDAQKRTIELIDFVIYKSKIFQNISLNKRQSKVLNKLFKAGINGFSGGLSAENYISMTKTSRATATRDLQDLVEKNILVSQGKLKGMRYTLSFFSK